jgi:hypothetical protein
MSYVKHTQMPQTGQFVLIWSYDGKIWSDVCKWIDGVLYRYDKSSECDDENCGCDIGFEGIDQHPAMQENYQDLNYFTIRNERS